MNDTVITGTINYILLAGSGLQLWSVYSGTQTASLKGSIFLKHLDLLSKDLPLFCREMCIACFSSVCNFYCYTTTYYKMLSLQLLSVLKNVLNFICFLLSLFLFSYLFIYDKYPYGIANKCDMNISEIWTKFQASS